MSSVAALRGVLRVTPFRRLWYATALSSLGDWLGLLATTALATSLTHSYQAQNYALGGVLVVKLLPAIVLGPVAGAFADRFDRRRTMVVSDFIRFGFFLTIPLVHTVAWLLVASFLIECVSLFWLPAKDASVPNLVRRDQIEAANQLSLITTYGITPVLGAALFSVLSLITNVLARHLHFFRAQPVNLALYFNAGTFLFGALLSPIGWVTPGLGSLGLFAAAGCVSVAALLCVNRSLKLAPASVVVPYQYSMIVWAVMFGYVVFGDVPSAATIIGAAIIIGAGFYIFLREQKLGRKETVVNPPV